MLARSIFRYSVASLVVALQAVVLIQPANAQQQETGKTAADHIKRAADKLNQKQLYKLEYKLKKGEKIRFSTDQVLATTVQGAGFTEEHSSRSEAVKSWEVKNVDSLGNMTFVFTNESFKAWSKIGDADPVAFDSTKDKEVPEEYKGIVDTIGKPLILFSIAPNGKILDRKSSLPKLNSQSSATIPLPNEAIAVGQKWVEDKVLMGNDDRGKKVQLKARVVYELARVDGANAFIRFRTEVLTPITSEKVKSTILQSLEKGTIVFDVAAGRPLLREVELDEKSQGFEGADSLLKYNGRTTEKLVTDAKDGGNRQALKPLAPEASNDDKPLKLRDGKPVMRK